MDYETRTQEKLVEVALPLDDINAGQGPREGDPPRASEHAAPVVGDVGNGVNESVGRIVSENCRTLKFQSHGFDEE